MPRGVTPKPKRIFETNMGKNQSPRRSSSRQGSLAHPRNADGEELPTVNQNKKRNPPDISGTRSRAYNTRLPEDLTTLGRTVSSRMGSITAARKAGGLRGMPINGAGIDYQNGNWMDNSGRTFATGKTEDSKPTLAHAINIHLHTNPPSDTSYAKAAKLRNRLNKRR